jgi:hypothetical protein
MVWAKTEGIKQHPEIAAYFAELRPFVKHEDAARPADRSRIRALTPIVHPDDQHIEEPNYRELEKAADAGLRGLAGSMVLGGLWAKIALTYRRQGPAGVIRKALAVTMRQFSKHLCVRDHKRR